MPAKTRSTNKKAALVPVPRFNPAGKLDLTFADSEERKQIEVSMAVYTNRNVYTLSTTVEDEEFILVNTSDQLSEAERKNFLLYTGRREVDVTGGLDVRVVMTGESGEEGSPQGKAWLIVEIKDDTGAKTTNDAEAIACGTEGKIERLFRYAV